MRSTPRWLFAAALAISIAGCKEEDKGAEHRVVVLFTTDEHSQLFATAPELDDFPLRQTAGAGTLVGGVARRAAILDAERTAAHARGAETLTLSAGDFSQGSLASAAWIATSPELQLMKRMGYDAVALGNHEFDLGPRALAAAISAAEAQGGFPPLVLTNLFFSAESSADDGLADLYGPDPTKPIAPYRVLHTGHGLRIGIVASMGVEAGTVAGAAPPVTFWSATATTNAARFASVAAAIQGAVNALREVEKVDAVILLGHGGIGASPTAPGEDELLALQLQGVDLVVSGHSHRSTPAPRLVFASGRVVPVVQAKAYGQEVGRVELVFQDDGDAPRPYLDPAGTRFIPVDDRTLPTSDAALLGQLYALTIGYLEVGNPAVPAYPSFLEETLSTILGTPVVDDPAVLGDLYFRPLGKTDFDVVGLAAGETNGMNLDTDALLAAGRAFPANPGNPPVVAIQASGPIRGDLRVGATGDITFADLYRVVPLGGDPTVPDPATDPNAVPGYPLVHALIPTAALRGVIEGTLQQSLLNGDFFVTASGLKVKYDMTRPLYDPAASGGVGPGWVTYMALFDGTTETRLYEPGDPALAATAGFAVNPATSVQPAVTTLYVASFASAFGVPLLNDLTGQPYASLAEAVVRRPDGSAVKDYEALAAYVKAECDGNAARAGFLPSRYDASTAEGFVPRRMIDCTGGCPVPP